MNRRVYIPGALVLVIFSLMMASLACYSNQIPGVFELTPIPTRNPLPTPEDALFDIDQYAIAPFEMGREKFNLAINPEPLQPGLVNSKSACQPNSVADILYAGVAEDGAVYYLVNCTGSVGWTNENRLLGPLEFVSGSLALTTIGEDEQLVTVKTMAQSLAKLASGTANEQNDLQLIPMYKNLVDFDMVDVIPNLPGVNCESGMIVPVLNISSASPAAVVRSQQDISFQERIYYQIECPPGGNKGWVTNDYLLGPLEVNKADLALALSPEGAETYPLANRATYLTENNVGAECESNTLLTIQEARAIGSDVYYRVMCNDGQEGWTDASRFVGPLLFPEENANLVIYMPSSQTYVDELPPEVAERVLAELEATASTAEGETPDVDIEGETEAVTEETGAETGEGDGEAQERQVIEYAPPVYLTSNPSLAILPSLAKENEEPNVVGQCESGIVATSQQYTGSDIIYYEVTCQECLPVAEDVEAVCTGWVPQENLRGPIAFVPGDQAMLNASSIAMQEDEEDQTIHYARIPRDAVYVLGINTWFVGRCPYEDGMTITQVRLEKDKTREAFNFYYQVECMGVPANYEEYTDIEGKIRYTVTYGTGEPEKLTGWFKESELAPLSEAEQE